MDETSKSAHNKKKRKFSRRKIHSSDSSSVCSDSDEDYFPSKNVKWISRKKLPSSVKNATAESSNHSEKITDHFKMMLQKSKKQVLVENSPKMKCNLSVAKNQQSSESFNTCITKNGEPIEEELENKPPLNVDSVTKELEVLGGPPLKNGGEKNPKNVTKNAFSILMLPKGRKDDILNSNNKSLKSISITVNSDKKFIKSSVSCTLSLEDSVDDFEESAKNHRIISSLKSLSTHGKTESNETRFYSGPQLEQAENVLECDEENLFCESPSVKTKLTVNTILQKHSARKTTADKCLSNFVQDFQKSHYLDLDKKTKNALNDYENAYCSPQKIDKDIFKAETKSELCERARKEENDDDEADLDKLTEKMCRLTRKQKSSAPGNGLFNVKKCNNNYDGFVKENSSNVTLCSLSVDSDAYDLTDDNTRKISNYFKKISPEEFNNSRHTHKLTVKAEVHVPSCKNSLSQFVDCNAVAVDSLLFQGQNTLHSDFDAIEFVESVDVELEENPNFSIPCAAKIVSSAACVDKHSECKFIKTNIPLLLENNTDTFKLVIENKGELAESMSESANSGIESDNDKPEFAESNSEFIARIDKRVKINGKRVPATGEGELIKSEYESVRSKKGIANECSIASNIELLIEKDVRRATNNSFPEDKISSLHEDSPKCALCNEIPKLVTVASETANSLQELSECVGQKKSLSPNVDIPLKEAKTVALSRKLNITFSKSPNENVCCCDGVMSASLANSLIHQEGNSRATKGEKKCKRDTKKSGLNVPAVRRSRRIQTIVDNSKLSRDIDFDLEHFGTDKLLTAVAEGPPLAEKSPVDTVHDTPGEKIADKISKTENLSIIGKKSVRRSSRHLNVSRIAYVEVDSDEDSKKRTITFKKKTAKRLLEDFEGSVSKAAKRCKLHKTTNDNSEVIVEDNNVMLIARSRPTKLAPIFLTNFHNELNKNSKSEIEDERNNNSFADNCDTSNSSSVIVIEDDYSTINDDCSNIVLSTLSIVEDYWPVLPRLCHVRQLQEDVCTDLCSSESEFESPLRWRYEVLQDSVVDTSMSVLPSSNLLLNISKYTTPVNSQQSDNSCVVLNAPAMCFVLKYLKKSYPDIPIMKIFKRYLECQARAVACYRAEAVKSQNSTDTVMDESKNKKTLRRNLCHRSVEESLLEDNTFGTNRNRRSLNRLTANKKLRLSHSGSRRRSGEQSSDDNFSELDTKEFSDRMVDQSCSALNQPVQKSNCEVNAFVRSGSLAWRVRVPYAWTDLFAPAADEHVIGNEGAVFELKEWLECWKQRCADQQLNSTPASKKLMTASGSRLGTPQRRNRKDSDWLCSESDDSEDSRTSVLAEMGNTILLAGPVGSGKTSLVYALAEQLGYKVLEVNASTRRTGKSISSKLSEATQSQSLKHAKLSFGDKLSSFCRDQRGSKNEINNVRQSNNPIAALFMKQKETLSSKNIKKSEENLEKTFCKPKPNLNSSLRKFSPKFTHQSKRTPRKLSSSASAFKVSKKLIKTSVLLSNKRCRRNLSYKSVKDLTRRKSTESPVNLKIPYKCDDKGSRKMHCRNSVNKVEATESDTATLVKSSTPNKRGSAAVDEKHTLVLLEDIDLVFGDQDDGLLYAVNSVMATSKRPIVITTSSMSKGREASSVSYSLKHPHKVVLMTRPDLNTLALHLQLMALSATGVAVSGNFAAEVARLSGCDARAAILQLQYLLLGNTLESKTFPLQRSCTSGDIERKTEDTDLDSDLNDIFPELNAGDLFEFTPSVLYNFYPYCGAAIQQNICSAATQKCACPICKSSGIIAFIDGNPSISTSTIVASPKESALSSNASDKSFNVGNNTLSSLLNNDLQLLNMNFRLHHSHCHTLLPLLLPLPKKSIKEMDCFSNRIKKYPPDPDDSLLRKSALYQKYSWLDIDDDSDGEMNSRDANAFFNANEETEQKIGKGDKKYKGSTRQSAATEAGNQRTKEHNASNCHAIVIAPAQFNQNKTASEFCNLILSSTHNINTNDTVHEPDTCTNSNKVTRFVSKGDSRVNLSILLDLADLAVNFTHMDILQTCFNLGVASVHHQWLHSAPSNREETAVCAALDSFRSLSHLQSKPAAHVKCAASVEDENSSEPFVHLHDLQTNILDHVTVSSIKKTSCQVLKSLSKCTINSKNLSATSKEELCVPNILQYVKNWSYTTNNDSVSANRALDDHGISEGLKSSVQRKSTFDEKCSFSSFSPAKMLYLSSQSNTLTEETEAGLAVCFKLAKESPLYRRLQSRGVHGSDFLPFFRRVARQETINSVVQQLKRRTNSRGSTWARSAACLSQFGFSNVGQEDLIRLANALIE